MNSDLSEKLNELSISTDLFPEDPTEKSKTPPKLHRVVLMNMTTDEYILKYYGDVYLTTDTLLNDPNIDIIEEIYDDRLATEKENIARGDGSKCEHALIIRLIYEIVKLGENELFRMNDVMIGAKYQYGKYNESDMNKSHFLKCMLTSDKIRIDLNNQGNTPDIGAFVVVVGWIKIKYLNPDTKVHYIEAQFWNYNYEPELFFSKYYMERLSRYKIFDNIVTQSMEYDNTLLLDCTSLLNTLLDAEDTNVTEQKIDADTLSTELGNMNIFESFNAPKNDEISGTSKDSDIFHENLDIESTFNALEIHVVSDTTNEIDIIQSGGNQEN